MIELIPSENDDVAFLALAQRIANGAVATLQVREVYLVHIDNWFDWKWLGWRAVGWRTDRKEELGVPMGELTVPMFDPNRVCSERHFVWDANRSEWVSAGQPKPLHLHQPGRPDFAQPLDRFSKAAAFLWYSGNSVTNRAGSLMLYLSGAEGYAWYASFTKNEHWEVNRVRRTTRRELIAFEDCGRQIQREPCS